MKTVDKELVKQAYGDCDFCHTKNTEGITGSISRTEYTTFKTAQIIKDYKLVMPLFGKMYLKVDRENGYEYGYVASDLKQIKLEPLICLDCIKKLYKAL